MIKIFIRAGMHSPSLLPESSSLKFKLWIKLICMLNSGHPYLRPIGTKRFCCNWISSLLRGARISLQTQRDPLRHTAVQTIRPLQVICSSSVLLFPLNHLLEDKNEWNMLKEHAAKLKGHKCMRSCRIFERMTERELFSSIWLLW